MTLRMNPVLGREVRERMRTPKAFVALTIFVLLLVLTVYLVYQGSTTTGSLQVDLARQTRLGRDLYEWVLFIMLMLILFFIPGLTAGAIAGERERQTLLPLQVTLLRPRNVLVGKILSAIAFLALLIVASLPIMVVAYLLGGIRLIDALKGVGVLLLISFLVATMVVSLSAFAKRVQTATLLSYSFVALLVLLGPILFLTLRVIDSSRGGDIANAPAFIVAISPLSLVADATAGENVSVGNSPLTTVREQVVRAKAENNDSWFSWFPDDTFGGQFGFLNERSGFPAWGLATIGMTILAAGMFVLANRRLRTPAETER